MAEKLRSPSSKRTPETIARWYRNINAVGAVALVGAAGVFAAAAPGLYTLAGINGLQAAGGEAALRIARQKKKS